MFRVCRIVLKCDKYQRHVSIATESRDTFEIGSVVFGRDSGWSGPCVDGRLPVAAASEQVHFRQQAFQSPVQIEFLPEVESMQPGFSCEFFVTIGGRIGRHDPAIVEAERRDHHIGTHAVEMFDQ